MVRNYLKIAWRSLLKDKIFSGINIVSLSVAFAIALLLSLYALFELSFDRFHKNAASTYQIYATVQTSDGPKSHDSKPIPFASSLQEEVPGVEKISRYNGSKVLVIKGDKELSMGAAYVDPDFFSIFSFPFNQGDKAQLLTDKSTLVITKKAASILFGNEKALGQTVYLMIQGEKRPFTISSILENIPEQSSIQFDLAINFKHQSDAIYANNVGNWSNSNHSVYLQLSNGIDPSQFEKSTRAFTALHFKGFIEDYKKSGVQADQNGQYIQQKLLSLKDLHFTTEVNGNAKVSRVYPYLVLGIALLILFIASANFINMSIAKCTKRLQEIGMRKTLGASNTHLFFQFWGESILVYSCALILGVLLASMLLEPFQSTFRTSASFSNTLSPFVIIIYLMLLLIITFIAGGYPSLVMTKHNTIQSLKGKLKPTDKNYISDGLMILQFAITVLLISGTLVLRDQLEYMRSKDIGFNKEQVIAFPLNGKREDSQAIQLLRNELSDTPGIISISASNNILGLGKDGSSHESEIGFVYKGRRVDTNILSVDYDYIQTLDIELLEGRSFSRQFKSDSLGLIINQAMALQLEEKDPLQTQIFLSETIRYSVIGVVKNFNYQGFNSTIKPLTIFLQPKGDMSNVYIKVASTHLLSSMDEVKKAWNKIEPNVEFLGSYLDENIDRTLINERLMASMIGSGSILAIILSCVGLFAMSLLMVEQRKKEIGIRKVVGASVSTITFLLVKQFIVLVMLAFLISAPIAWWVCSNWLQTYVFRIELSIWTFLFAGVLVLLISIATIGGRTIRSALQNPIKSLQTE